MGSRQQKQPGPVHNIVNIGQNDGSWGNGRKPGWPGTEGGLARVGK